MKLLIVSTPFIPVPPPTYGGLERVVFNLAASLQQIGLDVTVACPTESHLPSDVRHLDVGPAKYQVQQDWLQAEKEAYERYRERLFEFDIVHDNSWFAWPYIAKRDNDSLRVIHTHHGHLNWRTPPPVRTANLVAISQYMAEVYTKQLGIPSRYVHNGIALEDYPFNSKPGTRLIFLGRISKLKQPLLAIEVARRAGIPIDVVGGDKFVDDPDYVQKVKESCDGEHARYLGEVQDNIKMQHLQSSRAILICSRMSEPFGLVAVEALALGRPVICLDDGALREIVEPSVGFVCRTPDEMVSVLKEGKDLAIDPERCRMRAEVFSKEKMAQKYAALYKEVLQGHEW
jgi:glycosyltransferase involved in cell wall biosynthesis